MTTDQKHPCKYGHLDCSDSERGPCSNEQFAKDYAEGRVDELGWPIINPPEEVRG